MIAYGPHLHLEYFPAVDLHWAHFSVCIGTKAAPAPLLGFEDQSTLDRVTMHVAQFLDALVLRPYVEVVKTALPYVSWFCCRPQSGLVAAAARGAQHAACETKLQGLHHGGRRPALRFAN